MKRSFVSSLIAILFLTLAVTGIMGFFMPFDILTIAVHSIIGFLFIGAIALHLKNNYKQLKKYFSSWNALIVILTVATLIAVILYQPMPVKAFLGLSKNLGPAVDQFKMKSGKLIYNYNPAPHYKMQLDFKGGSAFDKNTPPSIAIWLENTSHFHLKTLYHSDCENLQKQLPYWNFKKKEYDKYKAENDNLQKDEGHQDLDILSSATPNTSFDPADYIVPKNTERESPYRLLIELNIPNDSNETYKDQPSLIYAVEIDNRFPQSYQVLEIQGYPATKVEDGKVEWLLYFPDETITTARDLFDSALLTIDRSQPYN